MSARWLVVDGWEIALVPIVILGILVLMTGVRYAAKRLSLAPEAQRKIVHVAVGVSSLFFPLIFSTPLIVFILIGCAILVMLWLRRSKQTTGGLGGVLHSVSRPSYGEIYLALSVGFLFFHSQGAPVLYVLPLLIITLSDTASALIGTSYGRHRFAVANGSKSMEGVVAFFMVTWICGMIVLLLMSGAARFNVIVLSFLIAGFCALVEADSWRGLDNLFVPIGAHLLLATHLDADPATLLVVSTCFVAAVVLAIHYSSAWGISSHAARAYTIILFLILAVTIPANAILPILVIAMHGFASKSNPCRSKTPDLDLLAAMAGVSLLWLFAGNSIYTTVINLFNLTFAGAAVIFAGLAAAGPDVDRSWRYMLVPFSLTAVALCTLVAWANPVESRWYSPIWPPILVSVGISLATILNRPEWFRTWRSPKAFGIAMIVPVTLFVGHGVFA